MARKKTDETEVVLGKIYDLNNDILNNQIKIFENLNVKIDDNTMIVIVVALD